MKIKGHKLKEIDFTDHVLYISNAPNTMDVNDFFIHYGKYGEIQRIKMLKQYYSSEKYTDLDEIEYFAGSAILQFADKESRVKCLEDQKNNPFIINENVLFNETNNKNISNYFKKCGFLFFSSSFITDGKINQIFGFDPNNNQTENKPIQNIEILYPVEFKRPGMAIIEFSTEEYREQANSDFNIIQSIIEREKDIIIKENRDSIDYEAIFKKEKSSKNKPFNFDINFIIKHVLNSNEEFSFCLPSLELEEPSFASSKEDDDDDDEEELIPSIIYHPDRRIFNNSIQFQRWLDFEIEFRQQSFKVNSLLASQFSNKIKEQLSTNQIGNKNSNNGGFDRYFYSMDVDVEGDFQLVVDSLMGQRIIINTENAIFLLLCSRELQMEQLKSAVHQIVYDLTDSEITFQFAFQLCDSKNKEKILNNQYISYYDEKDELIKFYADFFAKNFFKICELSSFKSLPIDMICKTLDKLVYESKKNTTEKGKKKKVEDENEIDKRLSDWIIEYFEKNDSSRVRLIPYINKFIKQLSRSQLTSILSKPGANMNSLRDSISQLISQMSRSKNKSTSNDTTTNDNDNDFTPIVTEEESHYCSYDKKSPTTSGIFAFIKQKFGSISEVVDVTEPDSFSCIVDPQASEDQYFSSPSIENMWLQFDFSKHPFIIQAYTLKTINKDKCPHLKNWVIEGSNSNDDNWVELDRVENSTFLLNSPRYYTFIVRNEKNETYRYIRLRQINTQKNAAGQIILKAIEFYGTLIDQGKNETGTRYSNGKEWLGIFNYLTKKYHENPAKKEVKITSATDASNLVNFEWSNMNKMWKSSNVPNPYVKFDFNGKMEDAINSQKIKVTVEKYVLKTTMQQSYPRSWVVEGSNDGVNWKAIDDVKNNTSMSKIWTSYDFTCSNRQAASIPFSQIRIKMTGFNTKSNYYFYLSYIELYGKVIFE